MPVMSHHAMKSY